VWITLLVGGLPSACIRAQVGRFPDLGGVVTAAHAHVRFASVRDSLDWTAARDLAARSRGFRVIISLFDRRLSVMRGVDTVYDATVAVGMDSTLRWKETTWNFQTPRGRRVVQSKDENPIWIPPDWHYVEAAHHLGLRLEELERDRPVTLADGRRLEVRRAVVYIVATDGTPAPLPIGDEIIFDGVLYAPPLDTRNRRIPGELGRFRLDLGDGYLLHGTPDVESIGLASTHGCIRLADPDIEWLFRNIPTGTRVYIY
jgi:hypothetical protein